MHVSDPAFPFPVFFFVGKFCVNFGKLPQYCSISNGYTVLGIHITILSGAVRTCQVPVPGLGKTGKAETGLMQRGNFGAYRGGGGKARSGGKYRKAW
jgi:hypothetical protein